MTPPVRVAGSHHCKCSYTTFNSVKNLDTAQNPMHTSCVLV
uniref:Uncharacterized protein n=1 Tax=Anguilla anguilla TaxID=7936 RepID=A0A0E9UQB8_ANGAN